MCMVGVTIKFMSVKVFFIPLIRKFHTANRLGRRGCNDTASYNKRDVIAVCCKVRFKIWHGRVERYRLESTGD